MLYYISTVGIIIIIIIILLWPTWPDTSQNRILYFALVWINNFYFFNKSSIIKDMIGYKKNQQMEIIQLLLSNHRGGSWVITLVGTSFFLGSWILMCLTRQKQSPKIAEIISQAKQNVLSHTVSQYRHHQCSLPITFTSDSVLIHPFSTRPQLWNLNLIQLNETHACYLDLLLLLLRF